MLQIILEQNGFEAIVLGDHGDEPFDKLTAACPEDPVLLVCDLQLPGGSGVDLCGMILDKYPKCEVILITGAIDGPDIIPVRGSLQTPTLLRKPFSLSKFAKFAMALTANHRADKMQSSFGGA